MMNLALEAITRIINEGAFSNIALNEVMQKQKLSDHEKRLLTHIVLGTVENKILIDYYLGPLIKGKRIKPYLKNTLRMGVYMLDYMRLAPHYVVNTLVQMIKKTDFKGSRFVNGVLRTYQQMEKPDLTKLSREEYLHLKYSFPKELLTILMNEYPDQIEEILATMHEPTPNFYRINRLKVSPQEVQAILQSDKIAFEMMDDCLISRVSLIEHPLFESGKIIAQNPSSMKVAKTIHPLPGQQVLDICSGLGTKAMHLATLMENQGLVVACDIYPYKLRLIEENALKLGVAIIQTALVDAKSHKFDQRFDHVLVDAPCSGLGVIAHKVDLKYQMNQEKINELIVLQQAILENASQYVKVGGSLTYSTCTIERRENEEQIEKFINNHREFTVVFEELMLPSSQGDGFYICQMIRKECV